MCGSIISDQLHFDQLQHIVTLNMDKFGTRFGILDNSASGMTSYFFGTSLQNFGRIVILTYRVLYKNKNRSYNLSAGTLTLQSHISEVFLNKNSYKIYIAKCILTENAPKSICQPNSARLARGTYYYCTLPDTNNKPVIFNQCSMVYTAWKMRLSATESVWLSFWSLCPQAHYRGSVLYFDEERRLPDRL